MATATTNNNTRQRPPKVRSNSDYGRRSRVNGAAAAASSAMCSTIPSNHQQEGEDQQQRSTLLPQHYNRGGPSSAAAPAASSSSSSSSFISLSKDETLLVSSSGDVVSCRCRNSNYPSFEAPIACSSSSWQDECAVYCCEATDCDDLSTQLQDSSAFCSFTNTSSSVHRPRVSGRQQHGGGGGGLLGGSPSALVAQVAPAPPVSPSKQQNHQPGGSGSDSAAGLRGGGGLFREDNRNSSEEPVVVNNNNNTQQKARQAFRSQPLRSSASEVAVIDNRDLDAIEDDGSIVPIRSFDYSHFADGGNDMLPDDMNPPFNAQFNLELRQAASLSNGSPKISPNNHKDEFYSSSQHSQGLPFFHGVPTFLRSFQQIKVKQVSAHPLGSHVLLTSAEGLLFSYGLNDYGQLGIGVQTPVSGFHRGYVMTPTIVTPLVENGGKAIACAAGVNHSLVVVRTEERRLVKSCSFEHGQSPEAISSTTESVVHHQIYGFGRNDHMKIGLVSPKLAPQYSTGASATTTTGGGPPEEIMDAVVLPRRVALRCKVRPNSSHSEDEDDSLPSPGIFSVSASAEHSAALVRRASGDVELYTWGNATYGALGLPQPSPQLQQNLVAPNVINGDINGRKQQQSPVPQEVNVAPVPSFVSMLSLSSNPDAISSSLLLADEREYPMRVSLGRRCSFVLTSLGRCFSFGTSEEGMLGLGHKVIEEHKPTEIGLPVDFRGDRLTGVSAGATHVLACTESGRVLAWGCHDPFGKQQQQDEPSTTVPQEAQPVPGPSHQQPKEPVNNNHQEGVDQSDTRKIDWTPQPIELERTWTSSPTNNSNRRMGAMTTESTSHIVEVCAGYDCSVFVSQTGRVLSCGRNSGRLGLGDVQENIISAPKPMFGGLRLWQQHDRKKIIYHNNTVETSSVCSSPSSSSPPMPKPIKLNTRSFSAS